MWRWGKRLKISHGADELPLTRAAVRFYSLTPDAMDEQAAVASLWRALDLGSHLLIEPAAT